MTPEIRQSELFPLTGILDWLPDEIVFSLCSRYHALSGNSRASITCQQLFGDSLKGTSHDFPSRLAHFTNRTGGVLGASESVIRRRTILSYYFPFRSAADELDAIASMQGNGIGSLKFRLGILTSKFGANHPLKACPDCMVEDRRKHGVAFWHLSHQYPGTWLCLDHLSPLLQSTEKSTGVGRFLWLLPEKELLSRGLSFEKSSSTDRPLTQLLLELAKSANQLAALSEGFHFDAQILLRTYLASLSEYGLLAASGTLKGASIGASFFSMLKPLIGTPEFPTLPENETAAWNQISRLLRIPRSGVHPLRHLLLIQWLFGDWKNFLSAYRYNENTKHQSSSTDTNYIFDTHSDSKNIDRENLLKMLSEEGLSITASALRIGIDTATAMAWAADAGISIKRRSKKLKPVVREQLIADLKRGLDKKIVAEKFDISVQTITTTLRSEIGLHETWASARKEAVRSFMRTRWQELCVTYEDMGIKHVRAIDPRAYAWLYRNDRVWLEKASLQLGKVIRDKQNRVDWSSRDRQLSNDIKRVASEIFLKLPGKKIALWQLYQVLPELKIRLSSLSHLPLTRRAIDVIIRKKLPPNKQQHLF